MTYLRSYETTKWFANQANIETPTFDTLIISPDGETNIQLIITDDDGCIVADDLLLTVINNEVLVILANVFNPSNSTFGIETFDVISIVNRFAIYDRWGALVFDEKEFAPDDQSKRWDGTLNGSFVESGVYVFSISYTNQEGVAISIFGDVAVIR
ncbi:MAG: gliding motility-associated-like protein [Saprospiraceae bacterium]